MDNWRLHSKNPCAVVDGDIGLPVAAFFREDHARLFMAAPALVQACKDAITSGQLPPDGPTLASVLVALRDATGRTISELRAELHVHLTGLPASDWRPLSQDGGVQ